MEKEQNKLSRGIFFNVMLIIYGLLYLLRLLSILHPSAAKQIYQGGPPWSYIYNLIAFLLGTIGLIGIIRWKRNGIYLFGLVILANFLIDVLFFAPKPSLFTVVFSFGL